MSGSAVSLYYATSLGDRCGDFSQAVQLLLHTGEDLTSVDVNSDFLPSAPLPYGRPLDYGHNVRLLVYVYIDL